MPQVSRRFIDKKTQDKIFSLFISSLIKCNSQDRALKLVEDLFTPTEKIMFAKRVAIAYMLQEGYDYRFISQTLKVSTTTIGLLSSWLKIKGEGIRKIIEEIKRDSEMNALFSEFKDILQELIASSRGQNWSKSKKILWQTRREQREPF